MAIASWKWKSFSDAPMQHTMLRTVPSFSEASEARWFVMLLEHEGREAS